MGFLKKIFARMMYYNEYPSNVYLNNAIRFLSEDYEKNRVVIEEIYYAICAADGYFEADTAEMLESHGLFIAERHDGRVKG